MKAAAWDADGGCVAVSEPCPPLSDLGRQWRAMERAAGGSVFLSWPWIREVARTKGSRSRLLRITHSGRTVGLGLLGSARRRWPPAACCLNETGLTGPDRVMIEYNGLLTLPEWEAAAREALLTLLAGQHHRLVLSGVPTIWQARLIARGWQTRLLRSPQPAPFADLAIVDPADPLRHLSRNSRQQIRRSMRFYERLGPLGVSRAEGSGQTLAWFEEMVRLHREGWQRRGQPSTFTEPAIADFHRRMLAEPDSADMAELLRIAAGPQTLGFLYNLRGGTEIASYQSGFAYGEDADARPGLVAHVLAMAHYRRQGLTRYRFLAGDARYKTSLATGADELLWLTAFPAGMAGRTGDFLDRALAAATRRIGAFRRSHLPPDGSDGR